MRITLGQRVQCMPVAVYVSSLNFMDRVRPELYTVLQSLLQRLLDFLVDGLVHLDYILTSYNQYAVSSPCEFEVKMDPTEVREGLLYDLGHGKPSRSNSVACISKDGSEVVWRGEGRRDERASESVRTATGREGNRAGVSSKARILSRCDLKTSLRRLEIKQIFGGENKMTSDSKLYTYKLYSIQSETESSIW